MVLVSYINGIKNAILGSILDPKKEEVMVQKNGPNSSLVIINWNWHLKFRPIQSGTHPTLLVDRLVWGSNYTHDYIVAKFNVTRKDWNPRNGWESKKTNYINLLYN